MAEEDSALDKPEVAGDIRRGPPEPTTKSKARLAMALREIFAEVMKITLFLFTNFKKHPETSPARSMLNMLSKLPCMKLALRNYRVTKFTPIIRKVSSLEGGNGTIMAVPTGGKLLRQRQLKSISAERSATRRSRPGVQRSNGGYENSFSRAKIFREPSIMLISGKNRDKLEKSNRLSRFAQQRRGTQD